MQDKILILDFGSQYTQLIARRIRELNVYCEIYPFHHFDITPETKGIILSGSPHSVLEKESADVDTTLFGKLPVLGICYGAQLLIKKNGGALTQTDHREYGRATLNLVDTHNDLFRGVENDAQVWMSHGDTITRLPDCFQLTAKTKTIPIAGFKNEEKSVYGIQFHPEVTHTTPGKIILKNFIIHICGAKQSWTPATFIEKTVQQLKKQLGNDKMVMGLSGGVDSSVAAILIRQAIGKNLHCIFVDNGLLRKNEFENVLKLYKNIGLNVKGIDAKERFYKELKGESNPETKRKIIGRVFVDVFDNEARQIKKVKWLGQGTIYPDVIESIPVKGPSATIKSHHNVGGLPKKMTLNVVEPLKTLFKDEVRNVGKILNIPDTLIERHPFPGPGLGIRILGEITKKKIELLQEIDHIFIEALTSEGLYHEVWQAGAILLPIQSVGVMGDERTYEGVVALRAVSSLDGMTADWVQLPHSFLNKVSNQIINHVKGVNRVVYDISSKPPATIEWE